MDSRLTEIPQRQDLAQRLAASTITPGSIGFATIESLREGFHCAVFVGGAPVILTGEIYCEASKAQAEALARSPEVARLLKCAGHSGEINPGWTSGHHVTWGNQEYAVVDKPPTGEVSQHGDPGDLIAVVLGDRDGRIATALCVIPETINILSMRGEAPDAASTSPAPRGPTP